MSVGDTSFHFSPSGLPDLKDLNKSRALMRAEFKLVTGVEIPYCAGYNEDGTIVYIDHEVPEFADINGRQLSVWEHVMDHEMIESIILHSLGDEHYAGAHTIATNWEDTCVRANGFDPHAYENFWKPLIKSIGSRKAYRVPKDLSLVPYHDSKDQSTIAKMRFV